MTLQETIKKLNENCKYHRIYDDSDFIQLDNGKWLCPESCNIDYTIMCKSCDDIINNYKENETDYDVLVRWKLKKLQKKLEKRDDSDVFIDKIDDILLCFFKNKLYNK